MLFEGQARVSGANGPIARGYDQSVMTYDSHAKYQDAVLRGNVYWVADQTGKQMPAGLSASPVTVSLFNPLNSGVNAVLWYANLVSSVAPAAICTIWIGASYGTALAATTGTAAAPKNALVGNPKTGAVTPLTTATIAAAPVGIVVLGVIFTGAITTIPQQQSMGGFMDGSIVLAPGGTLSFQASAQTAATSSWGTWAWEEVPITA